MDNHNSEQAALLKAVQLAGGTQAAFAEKLREHTGRNVQQQHVSWWIAKSKKAPADYVLAIEAVSGVSRHELRSDVFGLDAAA